MNPGVLSVHNNRVVFVAMALVLVGGIVAYQQMGRLEDPEFTIKEALIITPYPGASAEEVAQEVTNPIESACQQLGQLERVESESSRGRSVVSAVIKDRYDKHRIPQVWDELRRKIADVQPQLPPVGARPVDGDRRFRRRVRHLSGHHRRRLLAVRSCAAMPSFCAASCCWCRTSRKSSSSANSRKSSFSKSRGSGWRSSASTRSRSTPSFRRKTSPPTAAACASATSTSRSIRKANFSSAEDMLELVIGSDRTGRQLFLRDVATLERGDQDPPRRLLRYDGKPAIGLGISTVQGGNVVTMGEGVRRKLEELKAVPADRHRDRRNQLPARGRRHGHQRVHVQPGQGGHHRLRRAAVRDGSQDRADHRHRAVPDDHGDVPRHVHEGRPPDGAHLAGALIIALCMLTDNAIIVIEGIKVGIEAGEDKLEVVREMVAQNQWPLFGATAIGILAFAAIGLSEDSTGEYCNSLFWVILISLSLSWVSSITVTPLLSYLMFKPLAGGAAASSDPYGRLVLPDLPQPADSGAPLSLGGGDRLASWRSSRRCSASPRSIRAFFRLRPGRNSWWTFFCRPALTSAKPRRSPATSSGTSRLSPASPTSRRSSAAAACASCSSTLRKERTGPSFSFWSMSMTGERSTDCFPTIQKHLDEQYPNANAVAKKFLLGPGEGGRIQVRFQRPDPGEAARTWRSGDESS